MANAANELVGTPFRLHGRDPDTGLDCAGLVELALRRIGHSYHAPLGYSLRNASIARLLEQTSVCPACRLHGSAGPDQSGDIALCTLGAAQNHLLIIDLSAARQPAFVHAHAGLRRVVRTPGAPPWPIIARWRLD